MMIVGVDNFARETIADHLAVGGIPNTDAHRAKAQEFCDWLNSFSCDDYGGRYFTIKENDYRLSRGMEDLV
jgi:hypothetical protein